MTTPELDMLPAATILRIKKACDAEGLDIVAFAWNVQRAVMDAWAASEHNPLNYPPHVCDAEAMRELAFVPCLRCVVRGAAARAAA